MSKVKTKQDPKSTETLEQYVYAIAKQEGAYSIVRIKVDSTTDLEKITEPDLLQLAVSKLAQLIRSE